MYDSNLLKVRHGGGCFATCFGAPFLLSGLFCIASPWLSGITWEGGKPPPLYFILPFGTIFVTVGGLFVFGRAGVDLDARRRIASVWWGLIFPIRREDISLPAETLVAIEKKLRRSKNSTYWVYEVKLDLSDRQVDVDHDRDWLKARRRAEEVAKHLGIGMVDRSEGEGALVELGDLDKPLAERLRESGSAFEFPPPPPNCRTKIAFPSNGVRLSIPSPGWSPLHAVLLVILLGVSTFLSIHYAGLLRDFGGRAIWEMLPFVGPFIFVFGFMVGSMILRDVFGSAEVDLDSREIRVEKRGFLGRRSETLLLSEVEDLVLHTGRDEPRGGRVAMYKRFIRIVSDRKAVDVGRGLPIEELRWLYELLRGLLARGG